MDEKDPRGAVTTSQRPRSPRVPVEFGLEVEGVDTSGQPLLVKGQATRISRGGATIVLDLEIPVGAVVKLVPPFGGKLDAEVNGAWIDEDNRRPHIGVRLLDKDGWFAE